MRTMLLWTMSSKVLNTYSTFSTYTSVSQTWCIQEIFSCLHRGWMNTLLLSLQDREGAVYGVRQCQCQCECECQCQCHTTEFI
jgi:hypothetical protein